MGELKYGRIKVWGIKVWVRVKERMGERMYRE